METSRPPRAPARRAAQGARPLDKASLRGRPFEGSSREERAARRAAASGAFHRTTEGKQSFLEANAVAPATQDVYADCVLELKRFVVAHGFSLGTPAEADLALTNFANYACAEGLDRG
eukprot:1049414-Pyramimonas_sp.AAC.2